MRLAALRHLRPFLLASAAQAQEEPGWPEAGALFTKRCILCHSSEDALLRLRLDSFESALAGNRGGPVPVAGNPAGSDLLRRTRGESPPQMLLVGEPLGREEVAILEGWVEAGLPEGEATPAPGWGSPSTLRMWIRSS